METAKKIYVHRVDIYFKAAIRIKQIQVKTEKNINCHPKQNML